MYKRQVYAKFEELSANFPAGVTYRIVWDPTVFVRESIRAVGQTLIEAVFLVVLVVILFLQTWRASIIPLIAVPVSIVGTFAWLYLLGYSINTLTLFGLVLAVGIVVDDAIVVVENVERYIEEGLDPLAAAHQAMKLSLIHIFQYIQNLWKRWFIFPIPNPSSFIYSSAIEFLSRCNLLKGIQISILTQLTWSK